MSVSALSNPAVAIALVAICFSGSACAGPLLCEEVTSHASVRSSCPGSDGRYIKVKHHVDDLFDLGMPEETSVLSNDLSRVEVKFKLGKKADERLLQLWHPLWSNGLSFGHGFDHDGKGKHAQLHVTPPSKSVPEPGSLLLLGIGLVGAALSRRLKRTG